MYNVITSFGNYPTRLKNGKPGPHTEEELGLMWFRHVANISAPGMLKKYRLVLLLPRSVLIPDIYTLDLDQWGEKKRFDENNKVQPWPVGPNMNFQQIQWLYVHGKLGGPFLWCEPDCIPVKATWLDDLFNEYERAGKPFMGGLVDAFTSKNSETGEMQRVPKHMTGNGIYPDKAYKIAPGLMECRGTAWDVYAANQILQPQNFHQVSHLIQHEIEDFEEPVINSADVVLYHPDKSGYLNRYFSGGNAQIAPEHHEPVPWSDTSRGLVEVSEKADQEAADEEPSIDMLLDLIDRACTNDKDVRRKVAYFMLDHGIVNQGFLGSHMKKKKRQEALSAAAQPTVHE